MSKVRVAMQGLTVWAAGNYEGDTSTVEIAQKEGKDFPTLRVDVVLHDGDNTLTRSRWYSFKPTAVWALEAFLEEIGVEYEKETDRNEAGEEVESLVFDPEDITGRKVIVELGVKEYKGKPQNEIVAIHSAE